MIEQVIIRNYKSIRELRLPLNKLNVLIGANGVGKSNFISFFELTKAIYEQRFGSYTLTKGGIDSLLYHGRKISENIQGLIDFDNNNAFFFQLKPTQSNKGYIEETGDFFNYDHNKEKDYSSWDRTQWDNAVEESNLINSSKWRASYLKKYLSSFTVYHFHDTSFSSPMRGSSEIDDNEYLRSNGSNLAAYLYKLEKTDEKAFRLIEGVTRSIAPYFKKFNLKPDPITPNKINLEWEEVDSDMYLNGYSFSDGTIRFIALATLLLQPNLPEIIIIDEPELGLHPVAINKFSALVKKASQTSQVIISTQSTNLVNCFEANDVIVVNRENNQSVFKHLSIEDLSVWINDYEYSLGEIWEKNLIGGQL
ncbi:AAA family ATPase [Bacteroides sp. 519]|uniref:AAA family ATPase n=1 Tax=Bacteroides sp. 519 TaxID=2302937 RepID=UPI0013D6A2B1|nr:AAA family ATPase [Bacteroides sp. 519]NDV59916.1 recombinase RecF [Bacteroides sp. 519]